ncbi:hypothetical protein GALMADRAFT_142391 [Galerina marginata CBS 339.88]|uniref:Ubiquitin-like domain-containing protein n=1 Tax=Galerina marginata (strain CBS 339.88) TaxID=685588 RepID=A0A067T2K8_GALM3|nr:hypothetical protein GALMADRAFT_142391 [Galerina marginata CBS 339.88]
MPKVTRGTSPTLQKAPFVFTYDGKRVLGMRPSSYRSAVTMCRELFPRIDSESTISFHTKELEACDGQLAEVSARYWEELIGSLKFLIVMTTNSTHIPRSSSKASLSMERRTSTTSTNDSVVSASPHDISLLIKLVDGTHFTMKVSRRHTIFKLATSAAQRQGKNPAEHCLIYRGFPLSASQTVEEHNLKEGEVLEFRKMPMMRAPALYLLAPEVMDVTVMLSLSSHLTMSAAYPMVAIRPGTATSSDSVKWNVSVHPTGAITERTSGLNVPYLSWEAFKRPPNPAPAYPSPDPRRRDEPPGFDLNKISVNSENSIALPIAKVDPYLDQALNKLGVHGQARYGFIAAWMPVLKKCKHVAIRFLPQDAYARSSPLNVFPLPDVVTRICIIFRDIPDHDLGNWSVGVNSRHLFSGTDVVGVDIRRASDSTLFRVLELSAMEVSLS